MVLLPSLILGAEVEGAGVLQVRGENDGLVAGLAWQLDTQVPGIEGDEDEVEILGRQVLGNELIESSDSVSKGTRGSNILPSQGGQARCGTVELAKAIKKTNFFDGRHDQIFIDRGCRM